MIGKSIFGASLILGLLLAPRASRAALPDFDFTRPNATNGWNATHDIAPLRTSPEGLAIQITGADPFITGPAGNYASAQPVFVRLRLRSDEGGFGQIFYFRTNTTERDSVHFRAPAGQWTELCVPLPPLGNGYRLRFDPPGKRGQCVLEFMRIENVHADGITHALATTNEIVLTLRARGATVRIAELAPYQNLADAATAPVVAQTRAGGESIVRIPRFDGARDRLYSGFVAVRAEASGRQRSLGAIHFVEELRGVSRYTEPFPAAASKKGLQVQMPDDAIALGVKHAALNVNLAQMVDLGGNTNNYVWSMDGQTYHFHRGYVDQLPVKRLSDAGMTVSLILLSYRSGNPALDRIMLHPDYNSAAPNQLSAFNTSTPDGLRHYRACIEFLADHYSRPDRLHGRAVNFIVGNEVDAHWHWYNLGLAPREVVVEDYLRSVRVAHQAVRKSSATGRVYLSLDHHWNLVYGNDPLRCAADRPFLDYFNRAARLGGDFDWHLAFHPYPENLGEPRSWLDKTATLNESTPRITFKNLEMLTRYLRQPELLHRSTPRRVILSEQGVHSPNRPAGELYQAAGYCYAYVRIAALDGIDSFILHRHVDHREEGGLNLGLWTRATNSISTPAAKKRVYEVFRQADTPAWESAFQFALPVIGITNWNQIKPRP